MLAWIGLALLLLSLNQQCRVELAKYGIASAVFYLLEFTFVDFNLALIVTQVVIITLHAKAMIKANKV